MNRFLVRAGWLGERAGRQHLLSITALALTIAVACSSSDLAPVARPSSVVVLNTTCAAGACSPQRILAFPDNQPRTPGGMWSLDLGVITTASACITLPSQASFRVVDAGTGAAKTYGWDTYSPVSLGAIAPSASLIQATPSTPSFVPARATGWTVSLPGTSAPAPANPCS